MREWLQAILMEMDGLIIVANGHIFYCPGKDLSAAWGEENLDEKWNTQTGDWSRNGTKAFIRDVNGDQKAEIFVSHSEPFGLPSVYVPKRRRWPMERTSYCR